MYKYVFLILLILTNKTQTEAQISNNASGKDIYSQYGTITYSVGEIFYVEKGSHYTLVEGIQNSYTNNLKAINSAIKLSIYPNPTSDFVHIKFPNDFSNSLTYKIYNNIGNELLHGSIQNTNAQISLTQLPASIYLLKVYLEQMEMASIKIIKIN